MKYLFLFIATLSISFQVNAQNLTIEQKIKTLNEQIVATTAGEQLIWLDSLSSLTLKNADYDYNPIARRTIDLASSLDSLDLVAKNIANYIYRKANVDGIPGDGLKVYNEYSPELKKVSSKKWLAKVYIEHGFSHFISGNIDSSFYYYHKTKNLAQEANDTYTLADAKVCLGEAYSKQGDFSKASQNLQEAAITFRKLKDTSKLIYVQKNITLLYRQSGFFKEAEKAIFEGLELSKSINSYRRIAVFSLFAAEEFERKGLQKERIAYLNDAIAYSYKSKYDLFNRFRFLSALSIAYSENDSIAKAQEILNKLEKEQELMSQEFNLRNKIYYLDAQKKLAAAKGNFKNAIVYGEESLQINTERKAYEETEAAAYFLSKTYEKSGDNDNALKHFKIHTKIKDSITGIHKTRALAYYQTLYETEKRDQEILTQKSNISLLQKESKIRDQWFLIAGILAALLFITFYLRNRYKQKLQRRVAIEQLRTKISADLHDDVGSVLTGLAMQTDLIERKVPEEHKEQLQKVSALSRAAMLQMRDAVWSMDARKDNWGALIDRIKEFASENLSARNIAYALDSNGIDGAKELPGAIRQNLYLISKEAIANILKHSTASQVKIALNKSKTFISLAIQDNGVVEMNGLTPSGLGLSNMKKRAAQLDGSVRFDHTNGFQVTIEIPYNL